MKTSRQEPVRLRLMSYNIRIGAGGGDLRNSPQQITLEAVAQLMVAESCDLIGLQEVDRFRQRTSLADQAAWLANRLNLQGAFQPAFTIRETPGTNGDYGVALLSRFPIRYSERFLLFKPDYRQSHPKYPDYYSEQRILMHAEVTIAGNPVHLFVTHLGLTPDQREQQIDQIIAVMDRIEGPKILMGDFNAEPEEPAMVRLSEKYTDVLTAAGVPHEDRKSYPAGTAPRVAIDYIYVTEEFKVRSARVIRDASLASDHNPVIGEVEFWPRLSKK